MLVNQLKRIPKHTSTIEAKKLSRECNVMKEVENPRFTNQEPLFID
jgi:hypothetical protein